VLWAFGTCEQRALSARLCHCLNKCLAEMAAYVRRCILSQAQQEAKMKRSSLFSLIIVAGCTGEANHLGNPFMLPVNALTSATENAIYNRRRAQVELIVKSDFRIGAPCPDEICSGASRRNWEPTSLGSSFVAMRPGPVRR